jgi:ubiquinone/menaquinone biosynthesis C-methylase UbiE
MADWPEKPTETFKTAEVIDRISNVGAILPYVDLEFVNTLPIKDGMSVLDVGCFNGRDLARLKYRHPGVRFTGVDIQPKCVDYCTNQWPDIEFLLADAAKLPFRNKSFDIVYCNNMLCELDAVTREAAIKEMSRVGKAVYICDIDAENNFIYQVING